MALYIPHSIFHLARLLYVRLETFGPYYIDTQHSSRVENNCYFFSESTKSRFLYNNNNNNLLLLLLWLLLRYIFLED